MTPSAPVPATLALLHSPAAVLLIGIEPQTAALRVAGLGSRRPALWAGTPAQALELLQAQAPFAEADVWQRHRMVTQWHHHGLALVPQLLHYWATHTERFALGRLVIADATLIARDLPLFSQIRRLVGGAVFVAGASASASAGTLGAACAGQLLTRADPHFGQQLETCLDRLALAASRDLQLHWASCMTEAQQQLVACGGLALRSLLAQRFAEYAVIGQPFGVLGLGHDGRLGWLQFIQGTSSLPIEVSPGLLSTLPSAINLPASPVETVVGDLGAAYFDLSRCATRMPAVTHLRDWLARQDPSQN